MIDYVRHLRQLVGDKELLQLPSVSVALRDDIGRVLFIRHNEGNVWLLPGGAIEPGEVPADAAKREMWEETGLLVRITRLLGVFGGSEFVVTYNNGHRTSYVMSVFEAVAEAGSLRVDGAEALAAQFVSETEVHQLPTALWVPPILPSIFSPQVDKLFQAATWKPPIP